MEVPYILGGGLNHYKHFLPRILEVHNQKNGKGLIGLYEISSKLEYAEWSSWDDKEIESIRNFILADWNCFVARENSDIGIDDLEYYSFFFNLKDLFSLWDLSNNDESLKNFVVFFYYNGTTLINKGLKLNDKDYGGEFANFINENQLLRHLEQAFFKADEIDEEYAEMISIVYQMIEQETKRNNGVFGM